MWKDAMGTSRCGIIHCEDSTIPGNGHVLQQSTTSSSRGLTGRLRRSAFSGRSPGRCLPGYWSQSRSPLLPSVLHGEQWAYAEGQLERSVFRPGDMHHLPRGTARGYRMADACFALEYARGVIPLMLPFGLADSFSSTLDLRTVAKTFRIYTAAVVAELAKGEI